MYKCIVARYNEDISWLEPIFDNCIIYNKGEPLNKTKFNVDEVITENELNTFKMASSMGDYQSETIVEELETILKMVSDSGLSPNTQWQLVPNMQFTMDMFAPETQQRLIGRAGGKSDMGMGIPRDAERHATQAALTQQQGGIRKEPVILIKSSQGYELLEGWHRTIQHFAKFPDGYTGPAYIAISTK